VRELWFAMGASRIYIDLKLAQLRIGLQPAAEREAAWRRTHARVGNELYHLCASRGGFFIKVHAARLAPRHRRWPLWGMANGMPVAVKVRRPDVHRFPRDLRAVRFAAGILQALELDFDLVSGIDELSERMAAELDLRNEYANTLSVGAKVSRLSRGAIVAPSALGATERCLVVSLVDGVPLSMLARGVAAEGAESAHSGALARLFAGRMLRALYKSYGQMILLGDGTFHADPHPGNLLVPSRPRTMLRALRAIAPPGIRALLPAPPPLLWLIDWGQCGGPMTAARRAQLAELFLALSESAGPSDTRGEARVATSLHALGVRTGEKTDEAAAAELARGMFDAGTVLVVETKAQKATSGSSSGLVETLPKDLFLVLRTTQMLRGLGAAAERAGAPPAGSLSRAWRPYARRARAAAAAA